MGMLAAFLVGFWMGTRAGPDGMRTPRGAGFGVLGSEEFRTTAAGVAGLAPGTPRQGLDLAFGPAPRQPRAA